MRSMGFISGQSSGTVHRLPVVPIGHFAFVPGGIVPDDDDHLFVFLACDCQQTDDKQPLLEAVGLSLTEIQHHLLGIAT